MTLDEAIERFDGSLAYSTNSKEICQYIADLLKELKERREEPEVTYCKDCVNRTRCTQRIKVYTFTGTSTASVAFCSRGKRPERRADE